MKTFQTEVRLGGSKILNIKETAGFFTVQNKILMKHAAKYELQKFVMAKELKKVLIGRAT